MIRLFLITAAVSLCMVSSLYAEITEKTMAIIKYGDTAYFSEELKNIPKINEKYKGERGDRYEGFTALHIAAESGRVDIATILLDKGADIESVNYSRETPLHCAAKNGKSEMIKFLLKKGAKIEAVTNGGEMPIHCAAEHGNAESIKILLDNKSPLDPVERRDKRTPLLLAINRGMSDNVKLLIERGANINAMGSGGFPAFLLAVSSGKRDMVEPFFAKGVDVKQMSTSGYTAMHSAALINNNVADIAVDLYAKGAKLDVPITGPSFTGYLPVHLAAKKGMTELIRFIAAKKGDINVRVESGSDKGKTAYDLAKNDHVKKVIGLLGGKSGE